MMEILPSAQAAGQKQQQDAELGQGSIFDFDEPAAGGGGGERRSRCPQHPPVPPMPDDPSERNEMEKETLGLFLSSHPLKEVRPALRAKVDCSLAEAADRKDGEWVTVGGMIVECKRIRTKKGDMMMFATLDDLEGQVEILVFNSAYQGERGQDRRRQARRRARAGRPQGPGRDQGRRPGRQPFEPTDQEIEKAREKMAELDAKAAVVHQVRVQLDGQVPATVLDDLKDLIGSHKGERDLVLVVGDRVLVLGPEFRVSGSANCLQDLKDTVAGDGDVALREVEAPFSAAVPEPVARRPSALVLSGAAPYGAGG